MSEPKIMTFLSTRPLDPRNRWRTIGVTVWVLVMGACQAKQHNPRPASTQTRTPPSPASPRVTGSADTAPPASAPRDTAKGAPSAAIPSEPKAARPAPEGVQPTESLLLAELLEKRGYQPPDTFKALITEIVKNDDGTVAYYPMDYLGTSADRDDWWPASTVKLYAAIAALEKARAMGFSPKAELTFHYEDKPVTQSLEHLVRRAITDSKNPEFDRLVELVTSDRLNRYFLTAENGLQKTVMLRAYSRRVLHPETGKSLNHHSPAITITEGNRTKTQPERLSKGDFPCDNNGNCTSLEELQEAMRRVVMHDHLKKGESYRMSPAGRKLLLSALKGEHARGGVADAIRAAFKERPFEIFHKAGYAPFWFSDNVFLRMNDTNERWLIAMANQPGRDALDEAARHVAALIASGELSRAREKRFLEMRRADAGRERVTLDVIARDAWRADPPGDFYERHRLEKLTVHHQGVTFTDSRKAPARLKTMQRYHQGAEKGFKDIAYHFVIDPAGNLYQGRPVWAAGETETDYDPRGHLLVCLLGDFETQTPEPAQIDALVHVLAYASETFDVSPETIEGHRDHAHTTCPGKNLHALIKDGTIAKRVSSLLKKERVRVNLLGGREGAEAVLAIKRGN